MLIIKEEARSLRLPSPCSYGRTPQTSRRETLTGHFPTSGDFIDRHFARDALERRTPRAWGDAGIGLIVLGFVALGILFAVESARTPHQQFDPRFILIMIVMGLIWFAANRK